MKGNQFIALLFTVIFLLGATQIASADISYTEANGKVTAETDSIWMQVTGNGNVPKYTFRSQSEANSTQHRMQFDQLFEFKDNNNNSKYDTGDTKVGSSLVALASLDVSLSSIVAVGSSDVSFNMSLKAKTLLSLQFNEITFQNHISSENESRLKFDVIIDSYNFASSDTMLALAFKLSSTTSNQTSTSKNDGSDVVNFGQGAYLESASTAMAGGSKVNVSMSVNESSSGEVMTYLSYPQFSGRLVHDPSIGMNENSASSSTTSSSNGSNTSVAPVLFGSILTVLVLVPIIRRHVKR